MRCIAYCVPSHRPRRPRRFPRNQGSQGPGIKYSSHPGIARLISGFLVPALVSGYSELLNGSKELDLILNGLVSSVSGINASAGAEALIQDGLPKLASLNVLCEVDDSFWNRVKEFRVIMLLRTTLNWVDALQESSALWLVSTEVLRLVRSLLPWIKHAEGDFWQKIYFLLFDSLEVRFLIPSVNRQSCVLAPSEYLPLKFAALKLVSQFATVQDVSVALEEQISTAKKTSLFEQILNLILVSGGSNLSYLFLIKQTTGIVNLRIFVIHSFVDCLDISHRRSSPRITLLKYNPFSVSFLTVALPTRQSGT
jgi:hypothetical protein